MLNFDQAPRIAAALLTRKDDGFHVARFHGSVWAPMSTSNSLRLKVDQTDEAHSAHLHRFAKRRETPTHGSCCGALCGQPRRSIVQRHSIECSPNGQVRPPFHSAVTRTPSSVGASQPAPAPPGRRFDTVFCRSQTPQNAQQSAKCKKPLFGLRTHEPRSGRQRSHQSTFSPRSDKHCVTLLRSGESNSVRSVVRCMCVSNDAATNCRYGRRPHRLF